jgi:GR25 family glycosyltransferase involved in LPS biosynthesis
MSIKNFDDIKNVFYINLESRVDRKTHIEQELKKVNLNGSRIDAVKIDKTNSEFKHSPLKQGLIGCTLSHIKCLEIALERKFNHIMIFEDDAEFIYPELLQSKINNFLETCREWDFVFISGDNIGQFEQVNENYIKVNRCQTTGCYLVNGRYIKTLIDNMKEALIKEEPFDTFFFSLQKVHNWYLLTPVLCTQRDDYSDIELQNVSYSSRILRFNKEG